MAKSVKERMREYFTEKKKTQTNLGNAKLLKEKDG